MLIGGGKEVIRPKSKSLDVILDDPRIISICFRNKETGWKGYSMEIIVKNVHAKIELHK